VITKPVGCAAPNVITLSNTEGLVLWDHCIQTGYQNAGNFTSVG